MSIIGLTMNLLLAALLGAALVMGWRLNRRLKALRDSHDGFAVAVRELNTAAARAEQGLSDLRAATDEAIDTLADRIEKGRSLAAKLEQLVDRSPVATAAAEPEPERRLGAMLSAAREGRPERLARRPLLTPLPSRPRANVEDDLFEDAPIAVDRVRGGRW